MNTFVPVTGDTPKATTFKMEREGATIILSPVVDLAEAGNAKSFEEGVVAALSDLSIKNLVVDFHEVDYFGSSAVALFVKLWKVMTHRNGYMAFCNLSEIENDILHVTRLDTIWFICASRAEAMKAVGNLLDDRFQHPEYIEPTVDETIIEEAYDVVPGMQAELKKEGQSQLAQFVREALDRTQGKPTRDDSTAANEIRKRHHIPTDLAKRIVVDVKAQWHQAHPAQSERRPGETITNSLGMKFVLISPGTYLMGSPQAEKYRFNNELQHQVTLSREFYLGVCTVTQEEWQAVMGNNPSHFQGEKNLPVESVSWNDGQEFLKTLRKKDQKPYRLPSEAEWEFACRAGTTTPFYFGEVISTKQANFDGNDTFGNGKEGVCRQKTTSAGSFPANALGLYDMHGNVLEWCQDWYEDYSDHDVVDPHGPHDGHRHVLRGGSWSYIPQHCRSAYRGWGGSAVRSKAVGLRVCFAGE